MSGWGLLFPAVSCRFRCFRRFRCSALFLLSLLFSTVLAVSAVSCCSCCFRCSLLFPLFPAVPPLWLFPAVSCCFLLFPAVSAVFAVFAAPAVPRRFRCSPLFPAVSCRSSAALAVPCCSLLFSAVPCCSGRFLRSPASCGDCILKCHTGRIRPCGISGRRPDAKASYFLLLVAGVTPHLISGRPFTGNTVPAGRSYRGECIGPCGPRFRSGQECIPQLSQSLRSRQLRYSHISCTPDTLHTLHTLHAPHALCTPFASRRSACPRLPRHPARPAHLGSTDIRRLRSRCKLDDRTRRILAGLEPLRTR